MVFTLSRDFELFRDARSDEERQPTVRLLLPRLSETYSRFLILIVRSRLFGLAFVHLAAESPNLATRRLALSTLMTQAVESPQITARIVQDGIEAQLSRSSSKPVSAEDQSARSTSRLAPLLSAITTFAESDDDSQSIQKQKYGLLADLILLAHREEICELVPAS